MAPEILAKFALSDERLRIAKSESENILVLAGPGAGKTHVLVAHACWLAHQRTGRVVILTYSRKAANDIKRRADAALDSHERRLVTAETIHAHALAILRTHGHRIGLRADVEPIESRDLQEIADAVARRSNLSLIEDFAERFERFQRLNRDLNAPTLPPLVKLVENELRATSKLDWGSCVRVATELLASNADIRESVMQHDRFVLLDEAQDCDPSQLAFLEQLVGPPPGARHLFIVMDPDQSLYAFRQANPELVREWAEKYVKEPIEITENRRCSPRIQAVAKYVIEKESHGSIGDGTAILHASQDREAEAAWLLEQISTRIGTGTPPEHIAVLARRRSRLSVLEPALSARLKIRSDPRDVWTPPEDRILITLAFIKDWRDEAFATEAATTYLVKIVELPPDSVRQLEQECLSKQQHPGDNLQFPPWTNLVKWLDEGRRRTPIELVDYLAKGASVEQEEVRALRELARQARNLSELLRLARVGPPMANESPTGVLVTTFHGAKGLEFDTVVIVGCEEGTIPDFRARDEKQLREERRALYVATTRAAKEVIFSWVKIDRSRGQSPSRFLPAATSPLWSVIMTDPTRK